MQISSRRVGKIRARQITPEPIFLRRRDFIGGLAGLAGAVFWPGPREGASARAEPPSKRWGEVAKSVYSTNEEPTSFHDATHYNNFYELGTGKTDPNRNARSLVTEPWSVRIDGEVDRPGSVPLEDFLKPHGLEERIYRLRCVEAWSMVIPWIGIGLGDVLKRFKPTSRAKYVAFESVLDPAHLPGQRRPVLAWPYREALRIDEAMHPLTILAIGLYGREILPQNGAPLRLVVPWKYGFKSIKSIVRIHLQETRPITSWNQSAPREYGFYANVNPGVPHPRWSQKRERRIGEFLKRPTGLFNGYAEEVADLYRGMDLRKSF